MTVSHCAILFLREKCADIVFLLKSQVCCLVTCVHGIKMNWEFQNTAVLQESNQVSLGLFTCFCYHVKNLTIRAFLVSLLERGHLIHHCRSKLSGYV